MKRSFLSQFNRGKDRLQATCSNNQPASRSELPSGQPSQRAALAGACLDRAFAGAIF
jgi:hypothetical protein